MQVIYSEKRWRTLELKRSKAIEVMERLAEFRPIVHGSVARGDVRESSDVDIAVLDPIPPYLIEVRLDYSHGYVIQATPSSTPKAYLSLDEKEEVMVSIPLAPLSRSETEFYAFGGQIDLEGLKRGLRVPGVNKALHLVIPKDYGHWEEPIVGKEDEVAKVLGISVLTVRERVALLTKRRERGHTGVFFKMKFYGNVEEALYGAVRKNKVLRRKLEEAGML